VPHIQCVQPGIITFLWNQRVQWVLAQSRG
jgi:hypothetical protein